MERKEEEKCENRQCREIPRKISTSLGNHNAKQCRLPGFEHGSQTTRSI